MPELPMNDSAQHYNTAAIATRNKWTTWANFFYDPTGGRDGNPAYSGDRSKTFLTERTSITVGQAWKFNQFLGQLMQIYNRDLEPTNFFGMLDIITDGRLRVHSFNDEAQQIVSGFVASTGKWYFIECNFTLSVVSTFLTVGWEVRVDNDPIDSGVFTSTTHLSDLGNRFTIATVVPYVSGGVQNLNCDFYMTDGEFLGDSACRAFWPRLDGFYTAGVPTIAGPHYPMVNEHIPDDGATTITLENVNDADSYLMDLISGFTEVKIAQFLWLVNKTDAGVSSFKGILRSSGTDVLTEEFFPNEHNFLYFRDGYRTSPHTASDWTVAELNAQEVGEKRIS